MAKATDEQVSRELLERLLRMREEERKVTKGRFPEDSVYRIHPEESPFYGKSIGDAMRADEMTTKTPWSEEAIRKKGTLTEKVSKLESQLAASKRALYKMKEERDELKRKLEAVVDVIQKAKNPIVVLTKEIENG